MNMRDYLTLHLDTQCSIGAACSKKVYGCKYTCENIQQPRSHDQIYTCVNYFAYM